MISVDHDEQTRVARVTLERPGRHNAVTLAMWRELKAVFDRLGGDPEVRAIILTGSGGSFCAGADISEFGKVRHTERQVADYQVAVDEAIDAIADAPKPVLAAISGYCLGGGCGLATACDFRFADDSAEFGVPAARLSIIYGARETQNLYAAVGLANAKRILFAGERMGADEAARIGLIERLTESPLEAAEEFATAMARNAPLSIAGAKFILNRLAKGPGALDPALAERLIHEASQSEDYAEGRKAFGEKRAPDFKGR